MVAMSSFRGGDMRAAIVAFLALLPAACSSAPSPNVPSVSGDLTVHGSEAAGIDFDNAECLLQPDASGDFVIVGPVEITEPVQIVARLKLTAGSLAGESTTVILAEPVGGELVFSDVSGLDAYGPNTRCMLTIEADAYQGTLGNSTGATSGRIVTFQARAGNIATLDWEVRPECSKREGTTQIDLAVKREGELLGSASAERPPLAISLGDLPPGEIDFDLHMQGPCITYLIRVDDASS